MAQGSKYCGMCGADQSLYEQPAQPSQPIYAPPPPPPPEYYPQQVPSYQQPAQPVYQPQPQMPQQATPAPQYQQPPIQPQTPIQTAPERVFAAIPMRRLKSLGRYDSFTIVITSCRLIVAQMTAKMASDAAMQARDQAKAEGKGFWGQWSEQLKGAFTFSQRYLTMDPNATLSETPGNFALDNAAIGEIKLHLKTINRGGGVDEQEFSVEFKSAQGTYEFRMQQNNQFVDMFKQIYGERVKMPFGYFSTGKGINIKIGI
jgi:hypothetical protein